MYLGYVRSKRENARKMKPHLDILATRLFGPYFVYAKRYLLKSMLCAENAIMELAIFIGIVITITLCIIIIN